MLLSEWLYKMVQKPRYLYYIALNIILICNQSMATLAFDKHLTRIWMHYQRSLSIHDHGRYASSGYRAENKRIFSDIFCSQVESGLARLCRMHFLVISVWGAAESGYSASNCHILIIQFSSCEQSCFQPQHQHQHQSTDSYYCSILCLGQTRGNYKVKSAGEALMIDSL